MASSRYPQGFCSVFIAQLAMHGRPHYPETNWFAALRLAEYQASMQRIQRTVEVKKGGRKLYTYEERKDYVSDRSPEMDELNNCCTRFLRSRGLDDLQWSAWTKSA